MKIIGTLLIVVSIALTILLAWKAIYANYQWTNEVYSNWTLSDKSSTLEAKSSYMDKFVSALQSANLADNNALIYKTADNNCANNVDAVSTLRDRLQQIKGMDENSFQYQQAIAQITQQEQGEATTMLDTLQGCWMKTHYYYLWNVFYILGMIAALILLFIVGAAFVISG